MSSVTKKDKDGFGESILHMTLNQDGSCLAVGTTKGFRIFNISPFREALNIQLSMDGEGASDEGQSHRPNNSGGIRIVEMLFRCNLLCLVGGGPNPQYPLNKVMIYDDHQSKCIGELSFRQPVVAVKLRRDRIAAATANKVYLYNFADLSLLDQIHTIANPIGIMALSPGSGTVLACPSIVAGHVRLELYSTRKSLLIEAHETNLAALALSIDGNSLATASVKGTIIRVFDVRSGDRLHELRRGTERASISCLTFRNPDNEWLATCSNKGTVHVFHLKHNHGRISSGNGNNSNETSESRRNLNYGGDQSVGETSTSSSFQKLGYAGSKLLNSVLNQNSYLRSEWSFAQVRGLSDPRLCTFLPENNRLAVIGGDGSFWVVDYETSGEADRVLYHSFLKSKADELRVGVAPRGSNGNDSVTNQSENIDDESEEDGFISIA
mmetsp:Transcript_10635/g.13851  ORF Transcript_10635/g.13851 Transcript_10635/m.13851 type:complete len:438 (-) Transcript_10635:80-1393(-)|eukprot:CAMPEP_0116051436 /NCGR_PEP_ID=MMETSP0322-20121206/979_1 /TAXON_ID=163516 /ORGANISM="Leptocylindrus danicus var. apora, Strain B651" /LENGTH=437 /DNA_ID=CAMNT_0003534185 /DNA_START=331 /DNA_END=1644 /DNA_ORIENTATION=+